MKKFRMLVLTDHSTHSEENSIYALLRTMAQHPRCERIDVASRGNTHNDLFFKNRIGRSLYVSPVDSSFHYFADGRRYKKNLRRVSLREFDCIFLRLPHPVEDEFLLFLQSQFPGEHIMNNPEGIIETSSKKFLLNFPELCPPMKLCRNLEDILEFKARFPIVLKPLKNYGGKGIVRIQNDTVADAQSKKSFAKFVQELEKMPEFAYLGMQFLVNVDQGDKRIIVCNGEVLGASLRLPAPGSWLCNAAQGGQPFAATLTEEEEIIVETTRESLAGRGIVMYGIDTLMGDHGKRLLSEINTLSIGGLTQIGILNKQPAVQRAAELLWDYVKCEMYGKSTPEA